jgi:hypothetical protein
MMGINHPNTKTQKPIPWSIVPKTFSKEIFYKGKGISTMTLKKIISRDDHNMSNFELIDHSFLIIFLATNM